MVTRLPTALCVTPATGSLTLAEPTARPLTVERPTQAWDWMQQTRLPPDHIDWVRPEVAHGWLRCIEDHGLPLGRDLLDEDLRPLPGMAVGWGGADLYALLERISAELSDARLSLLIATPAAQLLHITENFLGDYPGMRELAHRGSDWREAMLGNNGPGTAALLGRPVAFTGREHYSRRLHAFSTVGYPLEGPDGQVTAVVGLIGDGKVEASVLLGLMGLVVRLLAAEDPLRQSRGVAAALPYADRLVAARPVPASASLGQAVYVDTVTDDLVRQAVRLQARNIPILITGESGVGKEHLVRRVHAAGCRCDGPLVAINCASIPRDLIESELFGYEGGSFTGARSQGKPGKFLLANRGILFLDEIGDMSFDLQSTLLRVLDNSEFVPVGGAKPVKVDVHVLAATNVRLLDAVAQGRFRRDLYYRLNGAQLRLPPLRERPDKRDLIEFLLARECEQAGVPAKRLSAEAHELFHRHPWPGNIRELRSLLRNLVSIAVSDLLAPRDLPEDFLEEMGAGFQPALPALPRLQAAPAAVAANPGPGVGAAPSLEDWECQAIASALRQTDGNIAETARVLGISRSTLYVKLKRYGLSPQR